MKKLLARLKIHRKILHPWFDRCSQQLLLQNPTTFTEVAMRKLTFVPSPVLFIARGHSGTTALAKLLQIAGVYIGNPNDPDCLNKTLDSLYWTYGFQRNLVPRLFKPSCGCLVEPAVTVKMGLECLSRHLSGYEGGKWGVKTCEGAFSHVLYRFLFPDAKYVYLIRDGRDVILSGNGYLNLANATPYSPLRKIQWNYFKIITFGVSSDENICPFPLPAEPSKDDKIKQNRFWIQAKSWCEHIRMVKKLKETNELSENTFLLKYEDLCLRGLEVVQELFDFLNLEVSEDIKQFLERSVYTTSIGKWKNYSDYISCFDHKDVQKAFDLMKDELSELGYT